MEAFNTFVATYAALFPICNPLGNAAIFLGLTEGQDAATRNSQARKGSLYMFALLFGFFVSGTTLMHFFGFSLEAVRIAGGLVILRVGFNLLTPSKEQTHPAEEEAEAQTKEDISFSPLALPLLAGPGALAVVMGMSSTIAAPDYGQYASITCAIATVCATCWACLRESAGLQRALGRTGMNALTRIMGFLLICIAIQLLIGGITGWMESVHLIQAGTGA